MVVLTRRAARASSSCVRRTTTPAVTTYAVCRHDVWTRDCDCDERRTSSGAVRARPHPPTHRGAAGRLAETASGSPSVAPGARGNGSLTGATRDAAHGRARMGPARPPPNPPCASRGNPHPRRARRSLILSLVSISHGTKKHPLKDDFQGILLIYTQCFYK